MFENILSYLLQEKRVIEYMDSDVRILSKNRSVHQTVGNTCCENKENHEMGEKLRHLEENQAACQQQIFSDLAKVTDRLEHIAQITNVSKNQRACELRQNVPVNF